MSAPCVPSADLDKALDDFGCLPSEVEADDRAFLGRGPSSAASGRSEWLDGWLRLVLSEACAMSANMPDKNAEPYDERNGCCAVSLWLWRDEDFVDRSRDLLRWSGDLFNSPQISLAVCCESALSILCRAYSVLTDVSAVAES